jgi:deoxyribodipyrimidine photo-lyase
LQREDVRVPATDLDVAGDVAMEDGPDLLRRLRIDHGVSPTNAFRGGYSEARRVLDDFVAKRLRRYAAARAHPGEAQISSLSPYLHFGQISAVEIALAVRDAAAEMESRASYLDELIVQRELAMNFVHYVPEYDRYTCLPDWARVSLDARRDDRRDYVYAYEQLAGAATHDRYWNAAMREMLATGFMHNYMRMYWGKKVLEWSASPEEGYATLLRLNNTYFLDGRDANSYSNVGWIFGLHDRPWPERPIFGTVRYMNAAGLKRKTDIESYLKRVDILVDRFG